MRCALLSRRCRTRVHVFPLDRVFALREDALRALADGAGVMTAKTPLTLFDIQTAWDGERLMTTVRGAADLLGVTPQTIRNWIRAGRVPVRHHPSGRRWLPVRSLWLDDLPPEVEEQIDRMRQGAAKLRELRAERAGEA